MENKENLAPEAVREKIESKVSRLLENEESFKGKKYGALNLDPLVFCEWKDRPAIDETAKDSVLDTRVILIETEGERTSIQLHVGTTKIGPREKYVYILNLPKGEKPELITYINKQVGIDFPDMPAPMIPGNMKETEASIKTLQVFSKFLEKGVYGK